jgi:hypothetical protein
MMKKVAVSMAISFLLYAPWAFGGPIPDLSVLDGPDIQPPILGQFPVQEDEEVLDDDGETKLGKITPEEALAAAGNISGVVYFSLKKDWGLEEKAQSQYQEPGFESSMGDFEPEQVVIGEYHATNDTPPDVEPSVIIQNRYPPVYHSVTAYISYQPDARNFFATTFDFANYTRGPLAIPAEYLRSPDPLMDQNPYTSGIAPRRIYVTGIIFKEQWTVPNAIGVWRSDDGGLTWSAPSVISNYDPNFFVDKPDIAVSWHPYSLGYVYVAYTRFKFGYPNNTRLFVARSTDGGVTFGTPVAVRTGNIQGAQILVNSFNGHVYVLWADYANNGIAMRTSYDYGQTWTAAESVVTGEMLDFLDPIAGLARAITLPMARFNWVANRICVVWHEYDSIPGGGQDTNIYYTSKAPGGLWQAKIRINDDSGVNEHYRDQFMPALDYDSNGNVIVGFYDRRDDPSNLRYHLYVSHINATGGSLEPNLRVSTFQSDPTSYPFIGDYQDIWCEPETGTGTDYFLDSWVGISSQPIQDIYLSLIQR